MMRYLFLFVGCYQVIFAWGGVGHAIINKNAVKHLPPAMQQFISQQLFFENHASDADSRIYLVTPRDTALFAEQYRHFLDIDDYPNFINLDKNLNNLIAVYGWNRVKENGTNPWILVTFMDSLEAQLKRSDWNSAYQTAADIGHYSGDPHQPLHATANYNGAMTGNSGIHSRYESEMVKRFQTQITVSKDSVKYVRDVYGFAFSYILKSNALCDSIFRADNAAKAFSGGSYNDTYYNTLWQRLGDMTKAQIQSATIDLASLWYTAWVNAGLLDAPVSVKRTGTTKPKSFNLHQNFPNPFNPKTTITFDVAERGSVRLDIISMEGKQVESILDQEFDEGTYSADWDASRVSSGVYLYRMESGDKTLTKKLLFVK